MNVLASVAEFFLLFFFMHQSRTLIFPGTTAGLPRCGARQWLAGGAVGDVGCDDREDKPGGQEPPPVKFGSKVERNYPHLEQGHQLQDKRGEGLGGECKQGVKQQHQRR